MGLFSGIREAKVSQGGVYIAPGVYRSKILAVKQGTTRKGVGFFVVELEHLKSNNESHPAGARVSWMVTLDKDAALGNVKEFLSIVTDTPEEQIDEEGVDLITSAQNPLKDTIVDISAINKPTKAGGEYTRVSWSLPPVAEVAASA